MPEDSETAIRYLTLVPVGLAMIIAFVAFKYLRVKGEKRSFENAEEYHMLHT